ncbi:Uncharacterised protein [uncultured archaeon]|nr:Uncharacterised protein [uncultured archaeon]
MKYILLLLLLAACVANPYVQPGMDNVTEGKIVARVLVQCWDNSTAVSVDKCPAKPVEKKEAVEVKVEQPVPIADKLLIDARSKFTNYAYLLEDRMVIVVGSKVRLLFLRMAQLDDRTPITDIFVDLDKKEAIAYCNVEREGRDILGDAFDWQRSRCRDYIDKPIPVPFEKWVPKGPLEYLEEFSALEPIVVENNVQTISIGGNSKTIMPSLHYMVDGKRVILRIDKRYQVPLKIEIEGQQAIDFRDAFFDTMVLYGKQLKIDDSWVTYQPVSDYWKKEPSK